MRKSELIRQQILQCRKCSLACPPKVRPVPFWGPAPCDIAVLGEAPGAVENREGRPFVGPAGQLLRRGLVEVGLDPNRMAWLNSVCCWPLKGAPPSHALDACYTNLLAQLRLIEPKFVLVVGGVALRRIKPAKRISDARGKPIWGRYAVWWPIMHPAWLLRNHTPHNEEEWLDDLRGFADLVRSQTSGADDFGQLLADGRRRRGNERSQVVPVGRQVLRTYRAD